MWTGLIFMLVTPSVGNTEQNVTTVLFSLMAVGIWTATCSFQYHHNYVRLTKCFLKTKRGALC